MKTGTVIKTFNAKDGRKVILRTLKWEDLDDFVEFINSLLEEGADIFTNKKVTREQETNWLSRQLAETEKGNKFVLLAEVKGKVARAESLAAMCRTQISIQKLLVEAYRTKKKNYLLQALLLDPVVNSVSRAEKLLDDMLELQADYLPDFK